MKCNTVVNDIYQCSQNWFGMFHGSLLEHDATSITLQGESRGCCSALPLFVVCLGCASYGIMLCNRELLHCTDTLGLFHGLRSNLIDLAVCVCLFVYFDGLLHMYDIFLSK